MDYLNLNTARAILVGATVLALLFTLVAGEWIAAVVLSVGVIAHGLMWVWMWRSAQRADTGDPLGH